jgi:hypothetical protein
VSLRAAALALGLAAVTAVSAAGTDAVTTAIAPYLQARDERRTGYVSGEAFAEPARPTGAPVPYADVSVLLLPADRALEAELDRIRGEIRESARTYFDSARRLRAAREAHERALLYAGGGELIRGEVSDTAGRFRLADVPAGSWLLLAWREVRHTVTTRAVPGRGAEAFVGNSESKGYAAIELWRLPVEVRRGEGTPVRLHDRTIWVTVVEEVRRIPVRTPPDGAGGKRRRSTTR